MGNERQLGRFVSSVGLIERDTGSKFLQMVYCTGLLEARRSPLSKQLCGSSKKFKSSKTIKMEPRRRAAPNCAR